MPIPSINDLKELTVQALGNLGGSARNQEILDEVARLGGVTEADQNQTNREGRLTFRSRLASAKTYLKNGGRIVNSATGVWALASGGVGAGQTERATAAAAGAIPPQKDLRELTVQALENLGGSAYNQEIFDEVARLGGVTEKDQNKTSRTGLIFYNRLATAKTHLKDDGKIKNIGHGEWALASGANAGQTEKATASAAGAIPSINEPKLKNLIVQALGNLGGSADIQKIEDEVTRLAGITEKERKETSATTGRRCLYDNLASARTHLKDDGKIKNIGHGEWALASGAAAAVRPKQPGRAKSNSPHGAEKPAAVNADRGNDDADALHRVQKALVALRTGLAPYVAEKMQKHYGDDWRRSAKRADRDEAGSELDLSGLLITILAKLDDVFQDFQRGGRLNKARKFVYASLDARNAASHDKGAMPGREALRHLDSIHELLAAVGAGEQAEIVGRLHEEQQRANLK